MMLFSNMGIRFLLVKLYVLQHQKVV